MSLAIAKNCMNTKMGQNNLIEKGHTRAIEKI